MLPGAPVELTLAGAVRQGRFLQFYYKQEARFWQASGCGGGGSASPLRLAPLERTPASPGESQVPSVLCGKVSGKANTDFAQFRSAHGMAPSSSANASPAPLSGSEKLLGTVLRDISTSFPIVIFSRHYKQIRFWQIRKSFWPVSSRLPSPKANAVGEPPSGATVSCRSPAGCSRPHSRRAKPRRNVNL